MTKELLQQALDALKNSTPIPLATDDDYAEGTWKLRLVAINGLEDALAQPVGPADAALILDASRYRWLRKNVSYGYGSSEGCNNKDAYLVVTGYGNRPKNLLTDGAVDAAMGRTK